MLPPLVVGQAGGTEIFWWLFYLIILLIVLSIIAKAIKIVREYERIVVFRLGRLLGAKGPGIVFLIPFIDKPIKVDLRESYISVSHQTCITKDNAPTDIDFIIYYKVVDPVSSVIQVQDFKGAAVGIATTTLRAVVGDIMLDDLLAKREEINKILRTKLDEVTERWGVKVTGVEIREILPPRAVQDAMIRQMAAERDRRAMVTEADGKRQSAILVAQGEKESAILKAEGQKQAAILRAEGDMQAAILRAKGYAEALRLVYEAASKIDHKTIAIQYLEALKEIGRSPATKYIFPMEFMGLLKPISEFIGKAAEGE